MRRSTKSDASGHVDKGHQDDNPDRSSFSQHPSHKSPSMHRINTNVDSSSIVYAASTKPSRTPISP